MANISKRSGGDNVVWAAAWRKKHQLRSVALYEQRSGIKHQHLVSMASKWQAATKARMASQQ